MEAKRKFKKYTTLEGQIGFLTNLAKRKNTKAEELWARRKLREIMKEHNLVQQPLRKGEERQPEGNIVEITERKCSPNIQPKIKVGKRYSIQGRDVMKDKKTEVLIIVDNLREDKNKPPMRCNAKRFSWRIISNEQLREEAIREEAHKTTDELLHRFTFEEHMQIAFVPLIIVQCAWIYSEKVLKECAAKKISETLKLGRAVKMLRQAYIDEQAQDLRPEQMRQIASECEKFMQACAMDFTIMEMTMRNEVLKARPDDPFNDMRAYAFCGSLLCEAYKRHLEKTDRFVAERLGKPNERTIANPKIESLQSCFEAYTAPIQIDKEHHYRLCSQIFENNIKKMDFVVGHEERIK